MYTALEVVQKVLKIGGGETTFASKHTICRLYYSGLKYCKLVMNLSRI